jgi:hypothetical protein
MPDGAKALPLAGIAPNDPIFQEFTDEKAIPRRRLPLDAELAAVLRTVQASPFPLFVDVN